MGGDNANWSLYWALCGAIQLYLVLCMQTPTQENGHAAGWGTSHVNFSFHSRLGWPPNALRVAPKKFTWLEKFLKTQAKSLHEPSHVNFSDAPRKTFRALGPNQTKKFTWLTNPSERFTWPGEGGRLGGCWVAMLGRERSARASGMSGVPEHTLF